MTLLSPDQIPLFLLLVLPGFISRKVYDLQVPGAQDDAARYAMDALFYGTLNAGLWIVPLTWASPGWFGPILVVALVLSPVVLSLATVRVLKSRRLHGWTRHPVPMAWDFFFARGIPCWVLFRLKNGKSIGGYFGPGSFASSFPNGRDIFVEQAWVVDEGGRFIRMVDGTAGALVSFDDCELLEFFEAVKGLPAEQETAHHG
ncbi:MAG: hypothetical protein IT183_11725 [Acidobacteria bacterium]|nr:hypothetical protein [Acidobacteriota bacterium]